MSEQNMRRRLVNELRLLDAVSVETKLEDGIPDVNYIDGWIECKWLRSWPKRDSTPVRLDHPLMPHQRAWLSRRNIRNGKAWVMLQCGREWLLFKGEKYITSKIGNVTKEELIKIAYVYWPNGLDREELIDAIT